MDVTEVGNEVASLDFNIIFFDKTVAVFAHMGARGLICLEVSHFEVVMELH